jgi:hypothetical protein
VLDTIEPLQFPKQRGDVNTGLDEIGFGWLIVITIELAQLLVSVTVAVYWPAHKFVDTRLFGLKLGFQLME